jgi:hypothetical protein
MNELEWRKDIITCPSGTIEVVHILAAHEERPGGKTFQYIGWDYKSWVFRRAPRKWEVMFNSRQEAHEKTFRTLKAAKAYALAIVRLNQ